MVEGDEVRGDRCRELFRAAAEIVGRDHAHSDPTAALLHSYDASLERGVPDLVVAPGDTDELRALVVAAHRFGVPVVMRGAGTGYSGGAIPARGGMVVLTRRLTRVLETDVESGLIRCEPGVVLATVHRIAERAGWRYLPDPSSHEVCTIGGNVAENAGGPHALGGGPTANYVTAVELVRPDGSTCCLHEQDPWDGGLDLRSLVIGSEGTLGAVASVTLRLVREAERERVVVATFADQDSALAALADLFDTGLLPSALDMLTGGFVPDLPHHTDPTMLFAGVRGCREEVAEQADRLVRHVTARGGTVDVLDVPRFLAYRAELVRDKVRRMVAVSGRPRYYLFDAVAPRSRLGELMASIRCAATEFDLPVLNTFHAGDGNVHPAAFHDPADAGHEERLRAFSERILTECARVGGALSGEHGVGLEKRALMREFFAPPVLRIMREVKRVFDPPGLHNPGKILPDELSGSTSASTAPSASSALSESVRRAGPPRVRHTDALVEVCDPGTTFGEVRALLGDGPYELPYEPLGGSPDLPVLAAVDAGLPGLREPVPSRVRDLLLGADLHRARGRPALRLGGVVAKDVAGYELRKLVYGARGRLGDLSAVRLRLLPRPSDTRLLTTPPAPLGEAVRLCRRLYAARIPFSYLGVLVAGDGMTAVTGRLEVCGGSLDRHLATVAAMTGPEAVGEENVVRWDDPVMGALAGSVLTGCSGLPWEHEALLASLAERGIAAFASVGHRRVWWPGEPASWLDRTGLVAATVDVFGATA